MTMTASPDLFSWSPPRREPDFHGSTYDRKRDQSRLSAQSTAVFELMRDGVWRTLPEIREITGAPEASISARLRDFRKCQFGSHKVERKYITRGQWAYRIIVNSNQEAA